MYHEVQAEIYFFHWEIQLFQHHLLERLIFPLNWLGALVVSIVSLISLSLHQYQGALVTLAI